MRTNGRDVVVPRSRAGSLIQDSDNQIGLATVRRRHPCHAQHHGTARDIAQHDDALARLTVGDRTCKRTHQDRRQRGTDHQHCHHGRRTSGFHGPVHE
jgi:hypothetical protein